MLHDIPIDSAEPASFAPSVESVTIRFNPAYYGPTKAVEIIVTDRHGNRVFRTRLTHKRNFTKTSYDWDGQRTNRRGYVDPSGSPYTIAVKADVPAPTGTVYNAYLHLREGSRSTVSSLRGWLPSLVGDKIMSPLTRQVEVHYHSIELSWGDYLPPEELATLDQFVQAKAPGYAGNAFLRDPKTVLWVWYKLSHMGYPAGPRTSVANDALGWAVLRYKQAHADLYRKIYGQAGNDYAITVALRDAAKEIDPPLITALSANQNNRFDRTRAAPENIVEELDVVTDPRLQTSVFIDVERFYVGTGAEFNGRRKSAVDREWCARPHLPIRAKVFLRDSRGRRVDNVNHRSALGDFRIKWTWEDDAFHTVGLPSHTAQRPSRTGTYLRRAHDAAKAAIPSPRHNARTAVGGLVSGDDRADAVAPFIACDPYALTVRDDGVETGPSADAHPSTSGVTAVHLAPSIIAGDTYRLTASLVTTNLPPQPAPYSLREETGTFEVWRRVRVDAALRWTTAAAFSNWSAVRRHFEMANMKILGPAQSLQVSALPGGARTAIQQAVDAFFTRERVWSKDPARDTLVFSDDHVYAQDPRLLEFEKLAAHGAAQFQSAANIINEVMIWSMQDDFEAWRKDNNRKPNDAVRKRSDVIALWQARGGWQAAVAQHFRAAIDAIFDTATNTCRDGLRAAQRFIDPLPHGAVGGLPASRADILHGLLMDPIEPELVTHRGGGAATIASIRTLRNFVVQIERDAKTTDETRKIPVHPILRQALLFYTQAYDEIGSGAANAYNLLAFDMEIRIQGTVPVNDPIAQALQAGPHNATAVNRVAPANKEVTFLRVNMPGRDAFDFNTFKGAHPTCHSIVFLRGAQAVTPRFTLPAAKEAEIDKRHRIRLANHQRESVVGALGNVCANLFPQIIDAMEDAMRAQLPANTRARSGIVMVQYSAHPGPVRVETGSPVDRDNVTNSMGLGLDMGLCFIPDQLPLDKAYLVAHELSHCMFLRHWQQAHDVVLQDFSNPEDHDMADANCIMSYSAWQQSVNHGGRAPCDTHFKVDRYSPSFCGKCNLALRGWDIAAQHHAAPLLPARSIDQELLNPVIAYANAGSPTVPGPVLLQAQTVDMITNLLHAPLIANPMVLNGNTLRFLGNPTLVKHGGHQVFRWVPLGANPIGGGAAIAAGGGDYDIPDGPAGRADAQILAGPNADYGAAWEKHLEFFKTSGGATNVPRDIVFNVHNFLFTPDTPIHEVIHVYQQWDAAVVHEGITELFGLMLAYHLQQADPGNAPQYRLTLNPSYMQVTQFAVDELLPRLGLTGLARLYFGGETAVLEKALITGKSTGAFGEACKAGIDQFDMTVAAMTLLPKDRRPPVDTTHDAAAQNHLNYALAQINQFMAANNPGGYGPGDRALHAKRIRLDTKIRVFDEALTQARTYRGQVTDRDRVHRLEAWIDETALQIAAYRDEL